MRTACAPTRHLHHGRIGGASPTVQSRRAVDIALPRTTACSHAAAAVHDGYVLNGSVVRSPVGGRLLNDCLHASLKSKDVALHPWYLYGHAAKAPGGGGQSALKERGGITDSHIAWGTEFLVQDIKESHCRTNEQPFVEEENLNMPMQTYELPDGSQVDIGVERFKIPEILFNPVSQLLLACG